MGKEMGQRKHKKFAWQRLLLPWYGWLERKTALWSLMRNQSDPTRPEAGMELRISPGARHNMYQSSSVCLLQHLAEQTQISSFINSM